MSGLIFNRSTIILLISMAVLTYSSAIGCIKDCDDFDCSEALSEEVCIDQNKLFIADWEGCNCCPTCVDYIPIGGECRVQSSEISTRTNQDAEIDNCVPGTQCIDNHCILLKN